MPVQLSSSCYFKICSTDLESFRASPCSQNQRRVAVLAADGRQLACIFWAPSWPERARAPTQLAHPSER